MLGIEYLWGGPVQLETTEAVASPQQARTPAIPGLAAPKIDTPKPREVKWQRVLYTMKDRKLNKNIL
jgi:stage V sporulation protein R